MFFSKKDYQVKIKGRSQVIYKEKEKTAVITAEMLAGATDLVIYGGSLRSWQPPHEGEDMSVDDKGRIKERVLKELERKGLVVEWE